MKIQDTSHLVTIVNDALGDFCQQFSAQRKKLANLDRAPARDRLFTYTDPNRDWAINSGGGTEIQFHLFFRENVCGYGLGFNPLYVPFKNEKTPIEYMLPFAEAYMKLQNSPVVKKLKDEGFSFLIGKEDELTHFTDGYYLFGKAINLGEENELAPADFERMIADIKGDLFSLYCSIFELKNQGDVEMAKTRSFVDLLQKNCNIVLTGAPGTGKTYLAWQNACAITGDPNPLEKGNEDKPHPHIDFCQFHPSMDYTDFVEGLRPLPPTGDGKDIHFNRKDGIFKAFCDKACKDPDAKYVFIIDEINRGDISKIFGELFFAIDPGYRGKKGKITTQYANLIGEKDSFKDGFYVPNNVYIIGTMNDIDRGVESMDFAIRRRFTWREVGPEETQEAILGCAILDESLRERAKNRMDNLNKAIADDSDLGPAFQIGAAYFAKLEGEDFGALWRLNIAPLLREYLRGNERKVIEEKIDHFLAEYNDETNKTEAETGSNPTAETNGEGQ